MLENFAKHHTTSSAVIIQDSHYAGCMRKERVLGLPDLFRGIGPWKTPRPWKLTKRY